MLSLHVVDDKTVWLDKYVVIFFSLNRNNLALIQDNKRNWYKSLLFGHPLRDNF